MFQMLAAVLPLIVATTFLVVIKVRAAAVPPPPEEELIPPPAAEGQAPNATTQPASSTAPEVPAASLPASPVISSSPPAAAPSPLSLPSPSPNGLSLRFLHGENPICTYSCDRTTPIAALKVQVASALGGSAVGGPGSRTMWIFQGQLLRDDMTLAGMSNIKSDDIVHVHVLQAPAPPAPTTPVAPATALQMGLHNRARQPQQTLQQQAGGQQQGQYLLPPQQQLGGGGGVGFGHGILGGGGGAMPPAGNLLYRTTFALTVALLGVLWGLVVVLGGKLFSLQSLLSLIFVSGIVAVGFVQAAIAG